jgi:hypothetical protein
MRHIEIKRIVDDYYNLDISRVTRRSLYVEARFMYFKLCMEFGDKKTLASIGASIKKDHATVLHGIKTLDGHMSYDKELNEKYQNLYTICSKDAGIKHYAGSMYHSLVNQIRILGEENKDLKNKIEEYERV